MKSSAPMRKHNFLDSKWHPNVSDVIDTDTSLTANSNLKLASQKAVKTYVDSQVGGIPDPLVYKGSIDCSTNPNYPAADAGHVYVVSVAGKIGGASGVTVESGDFVFCKVDESASGNQATVGANWNVTEKNVVWSNITITGGSISNTNIKEDDPLDGSYVALDSEDGILGETVAFGETVYMKAADSKWWKSLASASATSGPVRVGFCVVGGDADEETTIIFGGKIRADSLFDSFTISAPVYLSAATAGKIVSTAPTGTTGYIVRIVGHAIDANTVHLNISPNWLELA